MEIVIKIPDNTYRMIQNNKYDYGDMNIIIQNGTQLPKGHGRIGDLDALENEMINGIKAGNLEKGNEEYANINNMYDCVQCVKYADTIIEAESEDNNAIINQLEHISKAVGVLHSI